MTNDVNYEMMRMNGKFSAHHTHTWVRWGYAFWLLLLLSKLSVPCAQSFFFPLNFELLGLLGLIIDISCARVPCFDTCWREFFNFQSIDVKLFSCVYVCWSIFRFSMLCRIIQFFCSNWNQLWQYVLIALRRILSFIFYR